MKTKKIKRYIEELDTIMLHSDEDIELLAMISSRLDEIVDVNSNKELKGFIKTLCMMRDYAKTSSDYKFLDKVVYRIKEMV